MEVRDEILWRIEAEMETIQQQMVEAKKNERADALKEVQPLQRVWIYCWHVERLASCEV